MISHINSRNAFIVCGILLPVISVIISIAYFRHRGFIQLAEHGAATARLRLSAVAAAAARRGDQEHSRQRHYAGKDAA